MTPCTKKKASTGGISGWICDTGSRGNGAGVIKTGAIPLLLGWPKGYMTLGI